ncbi:restriction endonuclease subunit S [Saccharothrix sp. NRRL B-16314]|uniref:restriction endonuclease subunit S n=1 Tax=Saccharothrix sp. NRRL B-16314 TaxID=1463825 RepID=UPI0018CC3A1D|nr:restriction endonuclease subunit S [Saccharothrix sp. NRRL B-16314]
MSEYPPDWDVVELGRIGTWLSGGTPSTANPAYWDGEIPWISAASLKSFEIGESERRVTELGARSGTRKVPSGTVIFVVRGMSLKNEFRVGVTNREVAFGQDCKAILTPAGVGPRFLAYSLKVRENEILAMVDEAGHGTGRLPSQQIASLRIGLPDEREQRRIVDVLDSVDEAISSADRAIAKLRQVAHGRLAEFLFNQPERSARWSTALLGSVASISAGVTLGSEPRGPGTVELPYLRVANVKDGFIETLNVKRVRVRESDVGRFELLAGDMLMTEGGDFDKLGRGAVWDGRISPCLHQNHIFRVRCDTGKMLPHFLSAYSSSPCGRQWFVNTSKQTTNLASISLGQLSNFPVPCPPVADQALIVDQLAAIEATIDKLNLKIAKQLALRVGIADELLSGYVRVKT